MQTTDTPALVMKLFPFISPTGSQVLEYLSAKEIKPKVSAERGKHYGLLMLMELNTQFKFHLERMINQAKPSSA